MSTYQGLKIVYVAYKYSCVMYRVGIVGAFETVE